MKHMYTMFLKKLNFLLVFIYIFSFSHQCRDEKNRSVDWFVVYKFPKQNKHDNALIQGGFGYSFITSDSVMCGWQMSGVSINKSKSIPGLTLNSLYAGQSAMHILYNDEPPDNDGLSTMLEYGHTKGVLLSNDTSGFWLIHSVPHFPAPKSYSYPEQGLEYGQSFICLSLNLKNIDLVGKQLQYNQPYIYKNFIKNNLKYKLPNIVLAMEKNTIQNPPWNNKEELKTIEGQMFTSFAKTRDFDKDLYVDWVAADLKSDLYTETWLHGPERMPSDCGKKFFVNNVEQITFPIASNISFLSTTDHSKWAVSGSSRNSWICIGDINRAEHQKYRGGGTTCTNQIPRLWTNYRTIIQETEPCTKN